MRIDVDPLAFERAVQGISDAVDALGAEPGGLIGLSNVREAKRELRRLQRERAMLERVYLEAK